MLIGIEAERANNPKKTGVEHYAMQLILHLAKVDRVNNYVLYLRTSPERWFLELPKNFTVKVMPFPFFWTQIRLSWEMFFNPPDLLFVPASACPVVHPKKTVVTIHDLAWKFYPETFTKFMRRFLEWSTDFAVKKARKVIAVSEATKKDILKYYKVDSLKVEVVHHGYENKFSSKLQIQDRNLPKQYILFLSTLQPRKNLEGLIDAFALLKKELPEIAHKLVIVGKPGWKYENISAKIAEHKDQVVYLNHITEDEKYEVLKSAEVLVQPSFYEGFGMQILEAFALGVPVAASNVSSLPEVAGNAAVYFDPKNINEIKNAIKNILLDKSLSESLKVKGFERLKQFSWEKCATKTLQIFQSL